MSDAPRQLDIFADSRDLMLRNDLLAALERRDAASARAAWQALAAEFDKDPALTTAEVLIRVLERRDDRPFADPGSLARERSALVQGVATAARQALGAAAAAAWLRPQWAALAVRAERLPFDAARSDDHAAALWLRAGDWPAAARCVEGIESWRRIPAPLAWMAEASCRQHGLDASWPLLAELAWLAPARLQVLCMELGDALLSRLHKRFGAQFDGAEDIADLAWFPAWVLTQAPALAPHLARAQPGQHRAPEQGMRLLVELLGLERQGRHHDLMQHRRALRDLNAPLYAAYMATR